MSRSTNRLCFNIIRFSIITVRYIGLLLACLFILPFIMLILVCGFMALTSICISYSILYPIFYIFYYFKNEVFYYADKM